MKMRTFLTDFIEVCGGRTAKVKLVERALVLSVALVLFASFTGGSTAQAQITAHSITVTWVAPGDDSLAGKATAYDIRYSQTPLTPANWASATQATGEPTPKMAGSNETFVVDGLSPAVTYYIGVKSIDDAGNWSGLSNVVSATTSLLLDNDDEDNLVPKAFQLEQNFPNPFNPTTSIDFSIAKGAYVELVVLNILGEQVNTLVSGYLSAGSHQASWDGRDLYGHEAASGVYLYRLQSDSQVSVRKMILMR